MAKTNKKNIKGLNLYPWQKDVVDSLVAHTTGYKHVIISRRQCGKSALITQILCHYIFNFKGQYSLVVSPSYSQSEKIYNDIKEGLGGLPNVKFNDTKLTIKSNSTVEFGSAGQGDRLRGKTISRDGILIVDEAAFVPDDVMNSILLPMTNVHNSPILIASTPKFESGFFYHWYRRCFDGNTGYILHDFTGYDTSALLTPEQLDMYRLTLPRQQFENEYLGRFLSSDSEVFGDFSGSLITDNQNDTYSLGIDWGTGSGGDYTAVVGFDVERNMTICKRFNNLDTVTTIEEIVKIINEKNPKIITVEENSIGKVYWDLLKRRVPGVRKFNTSNDTKCKMVDWFCINIQQNNVKILDLMELKLEMTSFVMKPTPTGKRSYAADKNGHDDLVMAMLIAFQVFNQSANHYVVR